jgi:hypothetical protein
MNNLNKPRSDSTWNKLTPEQKASLQDWLFEHNLSYREVLERAQKEWNFTGSKSSLSRFYQALVRKRLRHDLDDTQATVMAAQDSKLNLTDLREGALKMIGKRWVAAALEPGECKELTKRPSLPACSCNTSSRRSSATGTSWRGKNSSSTRPRR